MAVVDLGLLGSGKTKSAGTNIACVNTTGAIIPAGTFIHICGTWNNIASVTAPTITSSTIGGATAIAGHATPIGSGVTTTAGSGVWHQCFRAVTTGDIASGANIATLTSNQSAVARGTAGRGFTGVLSTLRGTVATGVSTTGAPSVATTGTALVAGDVVIGSASAENNAIITGDADTLNGTWSTVVGNNTSGGAADTNISNTIQHKVVTATGVQTYNPTGGGADTIACVYAVLPVPDPAITQAAYRFYADGTESGSTALGTQSTAYTADLSAGDVNLGLRVRLQETGVGSVPVTDDWQLQYEKNTSGTWVNVVGTAAVDSYDETNADQYATLTAGDLTGQSFTGNGSSLNQCGFYGSQAAGGTGTVTAYLYAHSGTFGTSSVGTGSPLATSAPVDVSSLSPSPSRAWFYFTFDGTFTLVNGTKYVIAMTSSSTGNCEYGRDSAGTHAGNRCALTTGAWGVAATSDDVFTVLTAGNTVVPYVSALLDNTAPSTNRLGAGTGSFTAGDVTEDGVANDQGWPQGNYTEHLYSITLKAADLADADTLRFRVLRNGATTGITYTQVPTLNITEGGGGATVNATVALVGSSTLATTGVREQLAAVALVASATLTTTGTLLHYTNSQRNSSFEAGRADWDTFGPAAITFPTDTGEEITGHYVARLAATGAGAPQMRSTGVNRPPLGAPEYGQYLTAYANFQWETGTPSSCRLDVQFMDPDGTTVTQTNTGVPFTPTGSWTRVKNNDNLIPSGCASARLRFVIVSAVTADSILIEDLYAFVGPNIPDAGPDPDWSPHPSDIWEQPGAVPLSATSTLTATATVAGAVTQATVALAAASTLTVNAVREPQASVSLTAASTLTVTGTAFHVLVATVALTGTSTLTAMAVREPQAAVSLVATSTLSATAIRTQPATAALTGVSTLTATGFEQAISAVALVGVSTLSVTATVLGVQAATVALTAASTLTVAGVRGQAATVALTGSGTLTANAVRVPQASVSLTATSTLSVTAIRSAVPTVALSATSTLTATGTAFHVLVATVPLTAVSTLTATAVREPQAAVSLVAGSTLTATAIVDHFVNGQRNSSFEAGRESWDTFGPAAIGFPTDTGLAIHGTHVARLRATGAGTPMMRSTGVNRIPVAGGAGLYLNVYANFQWETGTVKECRMDVQFMDPDGTTVVQTNIGTLFTPSASAWTRILNNDNLIPVGAHEVRIRFVIPSAATSDSLLIEDIYSHLGSNIHNDGPHPPWTPHPEDIWEQEAAVPLVASSTLTATAIRFGVTSATVALISTSTLTANAVREPQASVSLVAGSTLTATAVRTRPATVALVATSTLTATASVLGQVPASVALTATSTLTATAVRGQQATVALTTVSTLTATGVKTRPAAVALSAASTLTATGTVAGANVVVAAAALAAVSTLTATAVRTPQASVGLTATSTLTVVGERVRPASVALTATALLTVTGVEIRVTAVTLTAASVLTATAVRSSVATVPLDATSTLTVEVLRIPQASVGLTATSILLVTATVRVPGPGIPNVAFTGFLHALDADMNWYPLTVPQ